MKTVKFTLCIIVLFTFSGLNEASGQWTTSGSNIYNTNSGNVGIGSSSPSTLLHVAKNMTEPTITVRNLGGAGGATYSMVDNASGANWKFKATSTGGFKIRDHANGLDVLVIEPNSAANRLYINTAGNVGIGTTAPAASFHVAEISPGFTGVFGTPISSWNSSTNVSIGDDNGFSILYLGQSDSYKGYVYWNYWDPPQLAFLGIGCANPINPVILQPFGGKVGINCYPSAALHLSVNGYDAYSGLMITNSRTGGKSLSINEGTLGKLNFTEPGVIDLVTMDFSTQNVGIGTTTPNNSALLHLSSTSKGFLPPRMTQDQINAIQSPSNGLLVFNTNDNKYYTYISNANTWKEVLYGTGTISQGSCGSPFTINHAVVPGGAAPVNKTVTYNTVTNIYGEPSKCWITSNLGADHQATSWDDYTEASAGWYWQFNRLQGYKNDGTTVTPAWTITGIAENLDWQAANDPCTFELGNGWRLPTFIEWVNVLYGGGGWTNCNGPWNSALKMHTAGFLNWDNGAVYTRGYTGFYWSTLGSNEDWDYSWGWHFTFHSEVCGLYLRYKADALSVRCIRE